MKTKKILQTIIIISTLLFLYGCSFFTQKGTVSLSLTDAPIADREDIEGVYITITSIEYNLNDEWIIDTNFEGPQTFNLLDLTNGKVSLLSNIILEEGTVSQIRFNLDAEIEDNSKDTNEDSNCYIIIDSDGTIDKIIDETDIKYPLFIPSGKQTGYKAVGEFIVPANGEVEITADFDVRKSIVQRGSKDSHDYLLKPTIRLIVNNQAGSISGSFSINNSTAYNSFTIFAYKTGEFEESELSPDSETPVYFDNAESSTQVMDSNDDGLPNTYILPFLAQGSYDLIVTGINSLNEYTILDSTSYVNIDVISEEKTTEDIEIIIPL
ncbi:MAG: DUF4382 domain-containing protein [Pleomorphochaeta sp.]